MAQKPAKFIGPRHMGKEGPGAWPEKACFGGPSAPSGAYGPPWGRRLLWAFGQSTWALLAWHFERGAGDQRPLVFGSPGPPLKMPGSLPMWTEN